MFRLKIFGERMKAVRNSRNITQQQMADDLKVSKSRISELEHAKTETNFTNLVKIADFLDVSTDYLLGRTDKK